MMRTALAPRLWLVIAAILALGSFGITGCGDDATSDDDADVDAIGEVMADADTDAAPGDGTDEETQPEVAPDTINEMVGDGVEPTPETADGVEETVDPLPALPTQAPFAAPVDPLQGSGQESCALYQEERCQDGKTQVCAIYDLGDADFTGDVDPLLKRAYLFDRWRDLYHRADGQLTERNFKGETLPGTPEAEWGAEEHFAHYGGGGDSGIWTGWAVTAAILRYVNTGSDADYQRMEEWVRGLMIKWDVTGIPGYLSRYHYIHLPAGGPNTSEHYIRWGDDSFVDWKEREIPNPGDVEGLPAAYVNGVPDDNGDLVQGVARWSGRPSIDQKSGSMVALPMAYELLKDEALKEKIRMQLTCYLKRLQRVELINLQANDEALQAFMDYFGGGQLTFDEGDIDFAKLDTIVGYVHRQINSLNEDDFDTSCPDEIQMEPWRVIDASSPAFVGELLQFVIDMAGHESEREKGINHYYFPSIRGGDAMHMMHLATMAYRFTGDEMYREFLFNELIGNIRTDEVIHTAGAFDPPNTCKKWYGDQITYGPWWAFLQLLGDSPLKTDLQQAFHTEWWEKLMFDSGNADFNIMYAATIPDSIALAKDEALTYALDQLARFGGNGGILDDPRRRYTTTPEQVMAAVPDDFEAICPTPLEIEHCEAEINFMGVALPGLVATHDCTGSEWECVYEGDRCAPKESSKALPVDLRNHTDYLWQRNPFAIGRAVSVEGGGQYPGSDYSVPYWNARKYGFITEGANQLLAWQTTGTCGPVVNPTCDLVLQTGCEDGEACYFSDPQNGSSLCWDEGSLPNGADCSSMALCAPGHDCFLDQGSDPHTYTCRAYCDDDHPCETGTCTENADVILGWKVCL